MEDEKTQFVSTPKSETPKTPGANNASAHQPQKPVVPKVVPAGRGGNIRKTAMIVVGVLVLVGALFAADYFWLHTVFNKDVQRKESNLAAADDKASQQQDETTEQQILDDIPTSVDKEEVEIVEAEPEMELTLNPVKRAIVDEVNKEKEIKRADEILDNAAAIGARDMEGKEDLEQEAAKAKIMEESPQEATKTRNDSPVNLAMVEQKPEFPGGTSEMYKWLSNNINYPTEAAEDGVQGKVTVSMIIEKDGRITNVHVVRGRHPALDKEAVRAVKSMPRWNPGRNNGQPVRVTYDLPISFKMQW